MNNENVFELLIAVFFAMSNQLGRLGPKSQDFMIYFYLGEVETPPQFHLRALQIRSEMFLLQYQTGHIKNLIGKYIMKLSKLKYLQRYMNPFEPNHRKF